MIRKSLLVAISLAAFAFMGALLGGYLGSVHPVGDSLSIFRPHVALLLALCGLMLLILRAWKPAALSLALAVSAGVPVLALFSAPRDTIASPHLVVYAKNLLFGRGDNAALLADIRDSGADLILLQELNSTRGSLLQDLQASHPHQHICQFSEWSGIAVLSRWPLEAPHCSAHRSLAAARAQTPEGPVWAVSTHLLWPYPHGQRHALDHELEYLQSLEGEVVIGGDFNMAPWGHSVQDMGRATDSELLGPIHVTIAPRGVPLSIDHVLSTGQGVTERRPRLGSDHYGLVAAITWDRHREFSQR